MHIKQLFKNKSSGLLNIYFTAGYPQLNSLAEILPALEATGVDMVEIGIPYSDPLSDGPVIQYSNQVAINNGITIDLIFQQLEITPTHIPKMMMAYFNSVFQYGVEAFCNKCSEHDISGLIIPDLPIDIYKTAYQNIFEKYCISNILLITPSTTAERIKAIDHLNPAFIYAVSSASTTGQKKDITASTHYLERIKDMHLQSPLMVGFNISTRQDFDFVNRYASGGIIGSAFIRALQNSENIPQTVHQFVSQFK